MKTDKINLFLTDDHPIFLDGIRAIFDTNHQIEVVGEAADGSELIEKMAGKNTNVLLLDIDMPQVSGLQIIDTVVKKFPQAYILVFSMHSDGEYIHQMIEKGAKGYLLKSSRKEELFKAIETVAKGESYLSKIVTNKLVTFLSSKEKRRKKNLESPLTKREIEVLKWVAKGLTNQEIGKQLHISPRTVDTHRTNIMEKLDLHNAVALTNYVVEMGL